MKKKRKSLIALLIAIGLIGVGYAAITTNLFVTGTAKIKADPENFEKNIQFATATSTTGGTATLSTDKKTITFTTKEFTAVGDSSTLTYTIKNGSNYNSSISGVVCTSSDSSYDEYVSVTPSRTSTLSLDKGDTSANETITVKMIKTYPEETTKSIVFTCTMTATGLAAN